ncbi:MAG: DUF2811 domain-containing protein [Aphanocapsa feldmannii 277cV]|uniref:DUF2811 domain-containing protein n=2 Tax=Aphanocapsa feldmannii TaxID=192050 RepID=A0A524RN59_9CHRO|nr:MAG: DUF2811 domain-containing protein [Aphanocapsa feldmannii 288cV]TGG92204.1 MAG: DUF2811 domain-containing protein [Aphanocapsa feldmannii 277cV]TGH21452.1 MAG: DUF2811 domain-containing protein [Aphanocapsa feldmannii 277cI]
MGIRLLSPLNVSIQAELPEELFSSMQQFIEAHPSWDQYRLISCALAGFLQQNGVRNREVTRCYLDGMFGRPVGCQPPS